MDEINVIIEETPALEASINAAAVTYEGGGTTYHSQLTERAFPDQHPISAITGLEDALESRISTGKLQEAVENALSIAKDSGEFKGEKGDVGETGPQGPQGEKGDTGAVGPQGPQGEKGDTGAVGPQGPQGEKGDTGAQGPQGEKGEKGEKGEDGTGITILGSYSALSELISAHPSGNVGDAYMIDGNLYVWSDIENTWINAGNIKGEKGDTGAQGPQGEKGEKGDTGADGAAGYTPVKGTDYFTEDDKAEMVERVLAALPTWEGGSY